MRLSTALSMILIISGIFYLFSLMYTEGNQNYPNAGLNNTAWINSSSGNSNFDYVNKMNSTIGKLYNKLAIMGSDDAAWYDKIAAGLSAIPYACILLPQAVIKGLETGGKISTGLIFMLALPGYVALLVIVYFMIWGVSKLLEFFQRVPV